MKNNFFKFYIAAFYFCSTFVLFAQTPPPPTDDGNGGLQGNDVAINDYVWILGLVGLTFVFLKLRAKHKQGVF